MNGNEVTINHPMQIVSFAHIDTESRDLYTYYFQVENAEIKIHSIDKWAKTSKNGNTYKHEEVFHFEYKKTITNYKTGEFEKPKIPERIWKDVRLYFIGYVVNHSI